ncbi:calcium-binding protein [Marivita sp.]|uniref:calcium-binding protein n=1 Tax=Marivita sp. TaxID=2003365 RepID=UPI0025C3420F|nr:calcium-binding protein [Marivita sp.]
MPAAISLAVGSALKAALVYKFTENVSAKFDLKEFIGMFKSGKSNDLAILNSLEDINDKLDSLGTQIGNLEEQLEEVGGLVEHSIDQSYADLIREINTDATSLMQTLVNVDALTQTTVETLLSDSNALLNSAISEITALAGDPNTSSDLLALSAFPTLTNAIAVRIAVVNKLSDQGLGHDAIDQQLSSAVNLITDIYGDYMDGGQGGIYETKARSEVEAEIIQVTMNTSAVYLLRSVGPGDIVREDVIADHNYFDAGVTLDASWGKLAGKTVSFVGNQTEMLDHINHLRDQIHPTEIAAEASETFYNAWGVFDAKRDIGDALLGSSYTGGPGNDVRSGSIHADYLNGGNGNDDLFGDMGSDVIHGGEGQDTIDGGRGHDRLYGDINRDTIYGDRGDDIIEGGDGRDEIWGGDHDDILYQSGKWLQGTASDHAEGGIIYGGSGDDDIYGDNGADVLDGGFGQDLIFGGDGNDVMWGQGGNDNLFGDRGNDKMFGGSGNDTLEGEQGSDTLDGGLGDDVLAGGAGVNFIFGGAGNDIAKIDGLISQYDFFQFEDGTLAIFGAPGHEMPLYFIAKRPDSIFDNGVETLEFDDYSINNHWNAGGPPSGFLPNPKEPSTKFDHFDEFQVEDQRPGLLQVEGSAFGPNTARDSAKTDQSSGYAYVDPPLVGLGIVDLEAAYHSLLL